MRRDQLPARRGRGPAGLWGPSRPWLLGATPGPCLRAGRGVGDSRGAFRGAWQVPEPRSPVPGLGRRGSQGCPAVSCPRGLGGRYSQGPRGLDPGGSLGGRLGEGSRGEGDLQGPLAASVRGLCVSRGPQRGEAPGERRTQASRAVGCCGGRSPASGGAGLAGLRSPAGSAFSGRGQTALCRQGKHSGGRPCPAPPSRSRLPAASPPASPCPPPPASPPWAAQGSPAALPRLLPAQGSELGAARLRRLPPAPISSKRRTSGQLSKKNAEPGCLHPLSTLRTPISLSHTQTHTQTHTHT